MVTPAASQSPPLSITGVNLALSPLWPYPCPWHRCRFWRVGRVGLCVSPPWVGVSGAGGAALVAVVPPVLPSPAPASRRGGRRCARGARRLEGRCGCWVLSRACIRASLRASSAFGRRPPNVRPMSAHSIFRRVSLAISDFLRIFARDYNCIHVCLTFNLSML